MKKTMFVVAILMIIAGVCIIFLEYNSQTTKTKSKEVQEVNINDKIEKIGNYFINNFPINSFDEIDNSEKLLFALYAYDYTKTNKKINGSAISDTLKAYFGKDISYTLENITDPTTNSIIYKYNKKTDKFIRNDKSTFIFNEKVDNYKYMSLDTENKLIPCKILYYNIVDNTMYLYNSREDITNNTNLVASVEIPEIGYVHMEDLKQYTTNLTTYNFHYEEELGKPIIKSVSIEN